MLFTTSHGIKNALKYIVKIPFAKQLLQSLSEAARGRCVVFFSLHRVLEDTIESTNHPHFLNKTAITLKQAEALITGINERLPFISLNDALEFLTGKKKMNRSHAVLLIEVPYVQTMRLVLPLLHDLRIPASIVLDSESIHDGQMPWMDEIIFRFGSSKRKEISVNFIDRSFSLASMADRMTAANYFIDHLSHLGKEALTSRLLQLREALSEVAIHPVSERISTIHQLEKIALNPLVSFICAGQRRLPFYDLSQKDAENEIVDAKHELSSLFSRTLLPVFFYTFGSERARHSEIIDMMIKNGYLAAIGHNFGVCRPGDNMFRLMRLPLSQGQKGFGQFEFQGLSDAIDEFLLVTLAKEKEL